MKPEIGSEFEFNFKQIMKKEEHSLNNLYGQYNYYFVGSGRGGIKQILLNLMTKYTSKEINDYLLPSYLCPSIIQAFKELELSVTYYKVNEDLSIDLDDLLSKVSGRTKAIYFINYFGALQPVPVRSVFTSLKDKGITIIEDITHNFFSKRDDIGDYLIASLRKWGPLPQGGLVLVNQNLDDYKDFFETPDLTFHISYQKAFASQLKSLYLEEVQDERLKETFLSIFNATNDALYSYAEIVPMDDLSLSILKRLDFEHFSTQRKRNYLYLYDQLKDIKDLNILLKDLNGEITPLGFHVTLDNRDTLRHYLVQNKVYVSVHWQLPEDIQNHFSNSLKLSRRILTIPCDQRYDLEDMERIVKLIRTFYGWINATQLVDFESR